MLQKKRFASILCMLSFLMLVVVMFSKPIEAEGAVINNQNVEIISKQELNLLGIVEPSPAATLTRYWTDGWVKTGNPAPAVAYFDGGNGYHGWLSKYKEFPQPHGTRGTYQGYFYHKSLPLPIPSLLTYDTVESYLLHMSEEGSFYL